MTRGDNHNIRCPHCGKAQHYVIDSGRPVPVGVATEFTKLCHDCNEPIYYWARWEITLTAEKERLVK